MTYLGGTLWAVRYNQFDEPSYIFCDGGGEPFTQAQVEAWFAEVRENIKSLYPDNPDLWPQLVSAGITWQVHE